MAGSWGQRSRQHQCQHLPAPGIDARLFLSHTRFAKSLRAAADAAGATGALARPTALGRAAPNPSRCCPTNGTLAAYIELVRIPAPFCSRERVPGLIISSKR